MATQRIARVAVVIAALTCLGGSVYLLGTSTESFPQLQRLVLAEIPPGYADRFTPSLYDKLIRAARLSGFGLLLFAACLLLLRHSVESVLTTAARDLQKVALFFGRPSFLRGNPQLFNACLALALLTGVLLRFYFVSQPLRKDEAYTYLYYARRPLVLGLSYYTANNHLLNTALMHFSTALFGGSVLALRLPTLLSGCLIPVLTYFAALVWYGRSAALISLSLVSVSSPLIEYSFNARGYSLGAVWFLLLIILIKPASRGLRGAWLSISVLASLALYSVPTMLYGVTAIYCYLCWRNRRRYPFYLVTSAAAALLLSACLYAPASLTVGLGVLIHNKWVAPIPRSEWPISFLAELISLGKYWNTDIPVLIVPLLGGALLWAILRKRTRILPPVSLLIILAFLFCLLLPLQSIVPPRRSYLYILPLCWIAIGTAARRMKDIFAVTLAAAIALGLGASVFFFRSLEHSGIESAGCRSAPEIVRSFRTSLQAGDQFICGDGFDSPLDFYLQRYAVRYHPLPTRGLLLVVKKGARPEQFVAGLGLSGKINGYKFLAAFNDADVYHADRGLNLPFLPGGDADIGAFTSY